MGKIKKEVVEEEAVGDVTIKEEDTYEDKIKNLCAIAQPLASKKLTKKVMKLIKKGKIQDIFESAYNSLNICM